MKKGLIAIFNQQIFVFGIINDMILSGRKSIFHQVFSSEEIKEEVKIDIVRERVR